MGNIRNSAAGSAVTPGSAGLDR